jgi:hypothetical protein
MTFNFFIFNFCWPSMGYETYLLNQELKLSLIQTIWIENDKIVRLQGKESVHFIFQRVMLGRYKPRMTTTQIPLMTY